MSVQVRQLTTRPDTAAPPPTHLPRSAMHQREKKKGMVNFDAKKDGTAWISIVGDEFDFSHCKLSQNGKRLTIFSLGGKVLTCFFQDLPIELALCMATHRRLGAFSPMAGLNSNILGTIAEMLFADTVRSIHCQGFSVANEFHIPPGAVMEYRGGKEATLFNPHRTTDCSSSTFGEDKMTVEVQDESVSFSAVRRQFVAAVEPAAGDEGGEDGGGNAAATDTGVVLAIFANDFREELRSSPFPRLIADEVSTSWSHDGTRIASCGFCKTDNWPLQRPFGPACVWDPASLAPRQYSVRPPHPDQGKWGKCVHLVFCPARPLVVSVWADRKLRVFAWASEKEEDQEGEEARDGLSQDEEEERDVWRLTGSHALPALLHCVQFDPTGRMLVCVWRKGSSRIRTEAFAMAIHADGSTELFGNCKLPPSDSGPLSVSVATAPNGCTAAVALEGVVEEGVGAVVVLVPFRRSI